MSSSTNRLPILGASVRVLSIDLGLLAVLSGEELELAKSMLGQTLPIVEIQASGYVVVEASARSTSGHLLTQSIALASHEYQVM